MNKSHLHTRFRYIVELDVPVKPRHLAYELASMPGYEEHLISVTDLQFNTHIYGSTYDYRTHKRASARSIRKAGRDSFWKGLAKEFVRQLKLFI